MTKNIKRIEHIMSNFTDDLKRKTANFSQSLGPKIARFMQGRNGVDALGVASIIGAVITTVIGYFPHLGIFNYVSALFFIYALFRMYSRNVIKRAEENLAFLNATEKPRRLLNLNYQKAKNHKTTSYFTCPDCGTSYSVPKGKGKVRVTCPKCKSKHLHTT